MKCKNCIHLFDLVDEDGNPDGKWCPEVNDSPDTEIDRECDKFEVMTNADRIRRMTDEELAELMDNAAEYFNCDDCKLKYSIECTSGNGCQTHILKWLKAEIK